MKKLSGRALKRLAKACELVDTGDEKYSCLAIEYGFGDSIPDDDPRPPQMTNLTEQYAAFYGRASILNQWGFDNAEDRVIAMLLFAEVAGGGVEKVL